MLQVSLINRAIRRGAGRLALTAVVWLLIASLALPPLLMPAAALATGPFYVVPGQSIQAAIDAASPGDTIIVRAGTYESEYLFIDKSIMLRSEAGVASTFLFPPGPDAPLITVLAPDVEVNGFTLAGAGAGQPALAATGTADGSRFVNNYIAFNYFGLYIQQSAGNTVKGNWFDQNNFGLVFDGAEDSTATGNVFTGSLPYAFYGNGGAGQYLYLNSIGAPQDYIAGSITLRSPQPVNYTYLDSPQQSFLGNYWEGYRGPDSNGDGVGDTPYFDDQYPLFDPPQYYALGAAPNRPSNISPAGGATGVGLTPTLQSSAFSDPDAGDTHLASQWQMTMSPGYYAPYPFFDSDFDPVHLTSLPVPGGILDGDSTYYWRVRHQDSSGAWSEWSQETSFSTVSSLYFDLQVTWQWTQTDWLTGQKIPLSFAVSNTGTGDSPPFTVRWELDGVLQAASSSFDAFPPQHNGGSSFGSLALNSSHVGQHMVTVYIQLGAAPADNDPSDNSDQNFILVAQATAPLPAPGNVVKAGPDNDNTPSFTWGAVSGAVSYEVAIDSQTGFAPAGSGPAFTVASPLLEGQHTFYVRAVDGSGSPGDTAFLYFLVDLTPPQVTDLWPLPDSFFDVFVGISAGYFDSLSGISQPSVRLLLDGVDVTAQAIVDTLGVSYTPPSPLGFGLHNVGLYVSDNAGNIAQAAWSFTIAGGHTWNLPAGWSMISLPAIPDNPDPNAVFGSLDYFILYTWDSAAGAYVQPEALEPGVAYWILLLEPASISISGTPLESYTVSLPQGWNMVGATADHTHLEDAGIEPAGALFNFVYTWDPELRMYVLSECLEPGLGYWALALQDLTLTVTPPPPPGSIS